jgi:hypothetical protein
MRIPVFWPYRISREAKRTDDVLRTTAARSLYSCEEQSAILTRVITRTGSQPGAAQVPC